MSIPRSMKAVVLNQGELEIRSNLPVPGIRSHDILVQTVAMGGNPTDWKGLQFKWGPDGAIVGTDVAGKVVRMGDDVDTNRFHIGDYVFGYLQGSNYYRPETGGFAEYVALDSELTFAAPKNVNHHVLTDQNIIPEGPVTTLEAGATIGCTWLTAGVTLFRHMKLDMEWEPSTSQKQGSILLWGGATALGQILIQLLHKLNAFEKIIVVASKKHESQLLKYGADEVYDYHDSNIIEQLKSSKHNNFSWLLDCVSTETTFNQLYQCAPDTTPSTLFNFLAMDINTIKPEYKVEKNNDLITIDYAIIYLACGYCVRLGDVEFPANPEYHSTVARFVKFITPYLHNGELHQIPVRIFHQGFHSAIQIVEDIQQGRNSGEKLVAVL